MKLKNMTIMAMLTAVGTITSHLIAIPTLGARVFPMQHAINVVGAIILGPVNAAIVAFSISLLRNMLGVGTLLAFPGSMVGALLAGYFYQWTKKEHFALLGEVIGTGFLGALIAYPIAKLLLGRDVLAYAYIIPFSLSSIAGALIGFIATRTLMAAAGHKVRIKVEGDKK